jgi:hypothetical protein
MHVVRAEMQAMFTGAIKWALGFVDADVTPRPAPLTLNGRK